LVGRPELYDWQRQLKVLRLEVPIDVHRFPSIDSNTLEELTIKELDLDLGYSKVSDLTPLAQLPTLTQLNLDLRYNKVGDLTALTKLNSCQTLVLTVSTNQRMSLKAIPPGVTHLEL